jgi:hypothetical protein
LLKKRIVQFLNGEKTMNYDKEKIEVTYEIINGKKIKIERIPTGMSGKSTPAKDYYDEDENQEYVNSTPSKIVYDEENTYLSTDKFLDI